MIHSASPEPPTNRRRDAWMLIGIVALGLTVYLRVVGFEFLYFDDEKIVSENPQILAGLTGDAVHWAFTNALFGIWMPLTTLTHMADVSLFGQWAGGHHLTNLVLHLANCVLAYYAFLSLTGNASRSAWIAALFAVHPFGASVVGWVSSRKELMWAFFFLWTLIAYARYVQKPGVSRYLCVWTAMGLGVLCKPMIVPLPALLLLLDVWPLDRWPRGLTRPQVFRYAAVRIAEKLPLAIWSVVGIGSAIWGQETVHAITLYGDVSWYTRCSNAVVSVVRYLFHWIIPVELSAHYPLANPAWSWWQVAGAAMIITLIFLAGIALRRKPYWAVGWLWFLIMISPVLGLVQFANASMADRYAYIPQLGFAMAAAWAGTEFFAYLNSRRARTDPKSSRKTQMSADTQRDAGAKSSIAYLRAAAMSAIAIYAIAGSWQAAYWHDTERLFNRALAVTPDNAMAHANLGYVALSRRQYHGAIQHYRQAVRIEPDNFLWQYNLGSVLAVCQRPAEAMEALRLALKGNPLHVPSLMNYGGALIQAGKPAEACAYYEKAVTLQPANISAYVNWARALSLAGDKNRALAVLGQALNQAPEDKLAQDELRRIQSPLEHQKN